MFLSAIVVEVKYSRLEWRPTAFLSMTSAIFIKQMLFYCRTTGRNAFLLLRWPDVAFVKTPITDELFLTSRNNI